MATLAQKLAKRAGDYVSVRTLVPITVTATANTDFVVKIPAGAVGLNFTVFTTTDFTAGTDAKISIGSTAGGVDYVAAVTIKTAGVYALTRVAAAAAVFLGQSASETTLNVRLVQSGTATAVGVATLEVSYGMPV